MKHETKSVVDLVRWAWSLSVVLLASSCIGLTARANDQGSSKAGAPEQDAVQVEGSAASAPPVPTRQEFILAKRVGTFGAPLSPDTTYCLKTGAPRNGPDDEAVLKSLETDLLANGFKAVRVSEGCTVDLYVNLGDMVVAQKGKSTRMDTRHAVAAQAEQLDTASMKAMDRITVDLTAVQFRNSYLAGGVLNAGLLTFGLGAIGDVTGLRSWFNEAVSGDSRGICLFNCSTWNYYWQNLVIVAAYQLSPSGPVQKFEVNVGVSSKEQQMARTFVIGWSDFVRGLTGQPQLSKDAAIDSVLVRHLPMKAQTTSAPAAR